MQRSEAKISLHSCTVTLEPSLFVDMLYSIQWFSLWRSYGEIILSREQLRFSCIPGPFWIGVSSKRKEYAPKGSKFFPFRVDPISEENHKLSPLEQMAENRPSVSWPLNQTAQMHRLIWVFPANKCDKDRTEMNELFIWKLCKSVSLIYLTLGSARSTSSLVT